MGKKRLPRGREGSRKETESKNGRNSSSD